jgi:hypothetical protein
VDRSHVGGRWAFSLVAVLCLVPGGAGGAGAEEEGPLAGISGVQALAWAKELSDDSMLGRKSGHASARKAEDWVAQTMGAMGLHPKDPAGTYLDPFTFLTTQIKAPVSLALDGKPLAYGAEFVDNLYSGGGKAEAEIVFVGYGISRPDLGWDDYAGADVKDKVVLALRGAPAPRAKELGTERQIGAKSALAREKGAKAFLIAEGAGPVVGTIQEKFFRRDLPCFWLCGAAADRVLTSLGTTIAKERARLDLAGATPGPARPTGVKATLEAGVEVFERATGHNALGSIDGRDGDLRGEIVLVGAHMDHLGVDAQGRVYNGADDNASGLAVLLHVAQVLKDASWRSKRTILFVGFGAEEQGLVGSTHLAQGLPFEHDAVVCVLNMDMVGQGSTEVTLAGVKRFGPLGQRLLGYLPESLKKQVVPEDDVGPGGDHWPFAERGVPAFFLATRGEHPGYHTVDDDAKNLKPECLEAAARVLGELIVRLGEDPEPLKGLR